MHTLVTVIHCFTCFLIVLLVLLQQGKGAEISASFGGSSQTVFGSSGGANFFVRVTQAAAAVFFVTSLALTILGGQQNKSLFESGGAPATSDAPPANTAPAAPAQPAAPAGNSAPATK